MYLQTAYTTGPTAPGPDVFLQKTGRISNGSDYFVGAYLPTVLAILFGLPWLIINQTAKSLEPFYQLSRAKGASAESSLTANFNAIIAPLKLLYYHQWSVVLTTTLMALGVLLTPLAPEAVSIHLDGKCDAKILGCTGRVGISKPVARTLQVLLALMAILTLILSRVWGERN